MDVGTAKKVLLPSPRRTHQIVFDGTVEVRIQIIIVSAVQMADPIGVLYDAHRGQLTRGIAQPLLAVDAVPRGHHEVGLVGAAQAVCPSHLAARLAESAPRQIGRRGR